jgi:hypothetical protein
MGCAAQQTVARSDYEDGNLMRAAYTIVDKLNYFAAHSLGPSDPLIVASFVNVNNLVDDHVDSDPYYRG